MPGKEKASRGGRRKTPTTDAPPAPAAPDIELLEFNRRQLATMLGVSVPTIAAALQSGAPGVVARGGRGVSACIRGPEFIQWWIERERNKIADRQRDGGSLTQQAQQVDVDLKVEKLKQVRGQLIDREAAMAVVRDVLVTCAQTLRQAPRRFGHMAIGLKDMPSAVEVLTNIADEQCADLRRPEKWLGLLEQRVSESAELAEP